MKYLSVMGTDQEILTAIDDIFLKNNWYDLDCTYGMGELYKGIQEPRIKTDISPLLPEVLKEDSRILDSIADCSLKSVVFDPPFIFRKRKSTTDEHRSSKYSYFNSYEELTNMYQQSIDCIYSKLVTGGYLLFKCQDMTDGKFYPTHVDIINYSINNGFMLKDIIIKKFTSKLQKDANQQSCVAKIHSYWLVFRK